MLRIVMKLPAVVVLLVIASGCWSHKELNDIAITVAIGFDKKGDQIEVSAQFVNPNEVAAKKGMGSKGAPVVTFSETGETVFEALEQMITKSPRKLYFSHLRMLVFSEQLAREGIGKMLDLLSRDHEFRTDFYIVIARGMTAENMLRTYTVPLEVIPANKIYKSLDTARKLWGGNVKITIDDLINDIVSDGKQAVLPGVRFTGSPDPNLKETAENVSHIKPISELEISSLAVLRRDKLVGWLSEDEGRAYNYIRGDIKRTFGNIDCPEGGKAAIEVIRSKSRIRGKVVDHMPEIEVRLRVEANVADMECTMNVSDVDRMSELENDLEQKLSAMLEQTIARVQATYKSDIFGFGDAIHRSSPKEWRMMKDDWVERFASLPVTVLVDLKLRRTGTLTKSFLGEMKG